MNTEDNTGSSSSSSKKKKVAASALAVALAAALLIGGTFSYISTASEEVENEFDTGDDIDISLTETTGTDYKVVPGVTEEKDPVITLTTTMDTYVFLLVDDDTYDLVDYSIDSIWTLLYSADDEDNPESGYDIYYALIDFSDYSSYTTEDNESAEYDEIVLTLNVLAGQSVSYGSWITASDLDITDDDGNEVDVSLSFKAYAIQAEPFSTAEYDDTDAATAAAKAALAGYYVPQAKVTQVTPYQVTISNSSSSSDVLGSITPDVIYVFEATESSTEAAASYYAKWVADFVVTFNTSGADSTELSSWNQYVAVAGQYDYYSSDYWIPILLTNVTNGSSYNLLQTLFGSSSWGGVDYYELCSIIKEFTCGTIQTVTLGGYSIDVPDGVVMTVELRLMESYDEGADYVSIGSWSYTFGSSDSGITNITSTLTDSTEDSSTE